jgi:hypothetical protein
VWSSPHRVALLRCGATVGLTKEYALRARKWPAAVMDDAGTPSGRENGPAHVGDNTSGRKDSPAVVMDDGVGMVISRSESVKIR